MADHVEVTGTGWGRQGQCVCIRSEAENKVRMGWAVRKAGQKPGNLSPVCGALLWLHSLDPNHPSASALPEPRCFHFNWVLHTHAPSRPSPLPVSQGQSHAVLQQEPLYVWAEPRMSKHPWNAIIGPVTNPPKCLS